MVDFPSAVAIPRDYGPPQIDFSWLANLPDRFAKGRQQVFDENQRQRTLALQQPISGDTQQVLQEVLKRGGAQYAEALLPFMLTQEQMKSAAQPDPYLSGGIAQPAQQPPPGNPPPASAAGGISTNMKTPVTQQGGDAGGSITDIVTSKLGNTPEAGAALSRIAMTMNIDPNAPLTKGQQVRVAGLLSRYAPQTAAPAAGMTQPNAAAPAPQSDTFNARFGAVPQAPQPAAPQPVPPQPAAAAPAAPQPQGGAQGPIGQQVPLPRGFQPGQEMQAAMALRTHAAQIVAANPRQQANANALNHWADLLEASTKPMPVSSMITLLDPRTGKVVYQGPGAQAFGGTESAETLDADAERYRQTGTLPPNMGRGVQGQQLAAAIRTRAAEKEIEDGGNPSDWPKRWAQFKTERGDVGQTDVLVKGLKSGEIPPTLTGIPVGERARIIAQATREGFPVSKAVIEWNRAQKQIQALNGPQMTRFVGLAQSVDNTISEVNELAAQMKLSGIPAFNRLELATYIQTQGNSPNGRLATRYITAVGTLKEEFANLANGGYAPTEPAWALANRQINENYGVYQLPDSLTEIQRLIRYRVQAVPGLTTVGPASANQYTGQPAATGPMFNPQPSNTNTNTQNSDQEGWVTLPNGNRIRQVQ